jgi:hypothetical protein
MSGVGHPADVRSAELGMDNVCDESGGMPQWMVQPAPVAVPANDLVGHQQQEQQFVGCQQQVLQSSVRPEPPGPMSEERKRLSSPLLSSPFLYLPPPQLYPNLTKINRIHPHALR